MDKITESKNHHYEPDKATKKIYKDFVRWFKPYLMQSIGDVINGDNTPDSVLRKAVDLIVDYKVESDVDAFRELTEEAAFCWFMRAVAWQYLKNKNMTNLDFMAACHALHPTNDLFQGPGDWTEDLFAMNDEIREHLSVLPLDNIFHVGWMYQYYISDLHDAFYAASKKSGKKVESTNDLVGATGIYTPYWVVRNMLENSLGRLWINHLNADEEETARRFGWSYYLPQAEQPPDVVMQLNDINRSFADLTPRDIKLLEPCMGTGLILLSAFDILMQIYDSEGIAPPDAARSILENNLFGIDIDNKAWRVAKFSLKARAAEHDPDILTQDVRMHLTAPVINGRDVDQNKLMWFGDDLHGLDRIKGLAMVQMLCYDFDIVLKTGALAIPRDGLDGDLMRRYINSPEEISGLETTQFQINNLLDLYDMVTQKYHVCCTNPPYLNAKHYDADVKDFFNNRGHIVIPPELDAWEDVYKPALVDELNGFIQIKNKPRNKRKQ